MRGSEAVGSRTSASPTSTVETVKAAVGDRAMCQEHATKIVAKAAGVVREIAALAAIDPHVALRLQAIQSRYSSRGLQSLSCHPR